MNQRHYWRALAGGVLLCASSGAALEAHSWRIERGNVSALVPLKPGGAFQATTSALAGKLSLEGGSPAVLKGEIAMDLATIDTGIGLRNKHLRENYLEVGKGPGFDRAVLSDVHLTNVENADFEGHTPFTATLLLHGVKGAVEGSADISREGAKRRVRAEFRLELTDFGVKAPEYLGVGVASKLLVTVELTAAPAEEAAP